MRTILLKVGLFFTQKLFTAKNIRWALTKILDIWEVRAQKTPSKADDKAIEEIRKALGV